MSFLPICMIAGLFFAFMIFPQMSVNDQAQIMRKKENATFGREYSQEKKDHLFYMNRKYIERDKKTNIPVSWY